MDLLRSYLSRGTSDSAMRLCLFIIVINSSLVCLAVCFIVVYTLITDGNFKDISEIIKACAYFVVGLLGPISIGKSVQSFGERSYKNNDNSGGVNQL